MTRSSNVSVRKRGFIGPQSRSSTYLLPGGLPTRAQSGTSGGGTHGPRSLHCVCALGLFAENFGSSQSRCRNGVFCQLAIDSRFLFICTALGFCTLPGWGWGWGWGWVIDFWNPGAFIFHNTASRWASLHSGTEGVWGCAEVKQVPSFSQV